MTTTPCPVCTGLVPTVDGNLIHHRHRDQLGPCPAGQVPDPGVDEGEALAGAERAVRGQLVERITDALVEFDREQHEGCRARYGAHGPFSDRLARIVRVNDAQHAAWAALAVVGPALDAARALVAQWNESDWIQDDTRDYSAPFADTLNTLAARVRELEEA